MLIYTSKNGYGWGKQKPKQWGPLSAVRSAVFKNAESLGIDPRIVLSVHPLWAGAGSILYGLGQAGNGSLNTATWSNKGLDTSSGNGLTETTTLITDAFARQHSCFSVITLNQNRKQGFFQRREVAGGAGIVCGQFDSGGVIRVYAGSSSVSERSSFVPITGECFAGCYVIDLNLANSERVKMFFGGELDQSTASGTHTTSGLATFATEIGYASAFSGFSWLRMDGDFHFYADFDGAISDESAARLTDTPYALIQPVSRPFYLDMGAGGGTSINSDFNVKFDMGGQVPSDFNTLYDIGGQVQSDFNIKYALLNIVSNDLNVPYSILNTIVSDFNVLYDVQDSVGSEFEIRFDLGSGVASDMQLVYDIAGVIFSDFRVRYDLGDIVITGKPNKRICIGLGVGI